MHWCTSGLWDLILQEALNRIHMLLPEIAEFSRCGVFTIKEAETLTNCGYIMQQLEKKQMQPENEQHNHFLNVIKGKHKPLYNHE